MEKGQREFFLRQQLKAIQEELGEGDDRAGRGQRAARADRGARPARGRAQGCRPRARAASRSCRRPPPSTASSAPTSTGSLTLPWNEDDRGQPRPRATRATILDEDHYDLEKVKERILEYLAVLKLEERPVAGRSSASSGRPASARRRSASRSRGRSAASSCASRSAACATRRRSAATGARTSARMPGHDHPGAARRRSRRTRSSCSTRSTRWAPTSAAIRRRAARGARPRAEQRRSATTTSTCRSTSRKVLFICTANTLDTIPEPAARPDGRDRSSPATPRTRSSRSRSDTSCRSSSRRTGSTGERLDVRATTALRAIIREYTREAGVRNLERRIADALPQGARAQIAEGTAREKRRDRRASACARGSARGGSDGRGRGSARPIPASRPGSRGRAVGGDILFIEATAYAGQGRADPDRPARRRDEGVGAGRALAGCARTRTSSASTRTGSREHDIHIHVPAGAVPKDGPSAGVTMATALVSLAPRRARRASDVGDDRRDHADRPGAADRRHQGEGARGAARRHQARDPAARQRARPRRAPGRDPRRARVRPRSTRSTRCWRRRSTARPAGPTVRST